MTYRRALRARTRRPVHSFLLDPRQETVDNDLSDNSFPRRLVQSRFQVFKEQRAKAPNPMQLDQATSR